MLLTHINLFTAKVPSNVSNHVHVLHVDVHYQLVTIYYVVKMARNIQQNAMQPVGMYILYIKLIPSTIEVI